MDIFSDKSPELPYHRFADGIKEASAKAILPMLSLSSGIGWAPDQTILESVTDTAQTVASKSFENWRQALDRSDSKPFPFEAQFLLVPWQSNEEDLYYGQNKISVNPVDWSKETPALLSTNDLEKKITVDLQTYQDKMATHPPSRVYLLGLKSRIYAPNSRAAFIDINVALGLMPFKAPFDDGDDTVHFSQLVVPEIPNPKRPSFPGNGPAVLLKFKYLLTDKLSPPKLDIVFGHLSRFSKGEFRVETSDLATSVPRLEGNVIKKWWLNRVAVNVGVTKAHLDLQRMQIERGETLLSPGIVWSGKNYVYSGFRVKKVDDEFTRNVNLELQTQLGEVKEKVGEKIEQGKEYIDEKLLKDIVLKVILNHLL